MLAHHVVLSLIFAAFLTVAHGTTCEQNVDLNHMYVSRNTKILNVTLYWASDPARALSALFAVILRKGLGYQGVYLRETKHYHLQSFAAAVPHEPTRQYEEVILALSIPWEPGHNPRWVPNGGAACGLAGPRLEDMGSSPVPLNQQLHVHLAEEFRNQSQCTNLTHWTFYTDTTALQQCGFTKLGRYAVVYELGLQNDTKAKLNEFAEALHFEVKITNRTNLFQMLRTGSESFLFMDYVYIWSDHEHVTAIPEPFCLPSAGFKCFLEPSSAVAMRVGDNSLLVEYGPELLRVAHNLPTNLTSSKAIREILELESNETDAEKAAYQWITNNNSALDWVKQEYSASHATYDIAVFYCKGDPYLTVYDGLIDNIYHPKINKMYSSVFQIHPWRFETDCSDVNYVKSQISRYISRGIKQRLIGAVVGSVRNITEVAKSVEGFNVPVLFYDAIGVNPSKITSGESIWLTTGRSRHLALAMRNFIINNKWTRVAVLSEPTESAKQFLGDLRALDGIAFGDHPVPLDLSQSEANRLLSKLKDNGSENARIILINTNYKDAVTILAAAASLEMNLTKDYAWMVREWRPDNKTTDIRHFSFSFWCRCIEDVSTGNGLQDFQKAIDSYFPNCQWPPHAVTLGDAMLTLANAFNESIHKCPQIRSDLRNHKANELYESSIIEVPTQGVTQKLVYNGHALRESVVFVDEWHGDKHSNLGRWRVKDDGKISIEQHKRDAYPQGDQPNDGSSGCLVSSGDPYLPTCHDWEWGTALIFLFLIPPTVLLAYRALRRRLKEHEDMIVCKVLAQRQQRAAALAAGYLVDRSAVSLRRELGSGRFGYVRLAWLRLPGRTPRFVAAKAFRDNQDESEILHEACVLASLHHENIIRLVGVCIDKDPPLVLMEVAFFGDLLQYLRDRRYLIEEANSDFQTDKADEEATHVSAEALTRLAHQAASALGYLALRGVIHRDLRASNCLVDANRSLKLADFGLARETKAVGTDGGAEYACRRRGLFPVLWMAPESLIHGVFSPASDVWALGLLVFELVTLGARPFGDMSPLRVMQYVSGGGKPTMPRDATPQAIALTRLCWQREPEQRPSAADVMAYLADRPNALRPAFDGDSEEPTDVDSGCGESPMSEFLPC